MTPEALVSLLEEMMDLKIQLHVEETLKCTPEVTRILADKRHTDKRRLEQIRSELCRFLNN